ncbi:MAG: hypothetical protein IKS31_10480 [Clostridia bacterium]|nr:hypothetical protein [Clostridia bacterium]
MDAQEKQRLMTYLRHAIRLEANLYEQDQLIRLRERQFEEKKPAPPKKELPPEPQAQAPAKMSKGAVAASVLFGYGVPALAMHAFNKRQARNANEEAQRQYQQDCKRAEQEYGAALSRYETALRRWREAKQEEISAMQFRRDETVRAATEFYARDIIYPKYRTLPALTSIYEYLASGRCSELTGPDGAYNMFEAELRQDIIIAQLGNVMDHLENIRNQQYVLYQEVSQINDRIRRVSGQLDEIGAMTALNTYYSAVAAANTEATEYVITAF